MRKETNKLLISPSRSNKWGSQWCALFPCHLLALLLGELGELGELVSTKPGDSLQPPPSEASDLEGWEGDIHPEVGGWERRGSL